MRRREFITLLGGAAAAWPHGARAQQSTMPVIGYVSTGGRATADEPPAAFRGGLQELGFIEGKNVVIEFRSTDGSLERLPKLMVDLVRSRVSAIFALGGDVATLVAMGATRTIPIVFLTNSDPVRSGLVASLNRPGGNVTGVTMLSGPLGAKLLQECCQYRAPAPIVPLMIRWGAADSTNVAPVSAMHAMRSQRCDDPAAKTGRTADACAGVAGRGAFSKLGVELPTPPVAALDRFKRQRKARPRGSAAFVSNKDDGLNAAAIRPLSGLGGGLYWVGETYPSPGLGATWPASTRTTIPRGT